MVLKGTPKISESPLELLNSQGIDPGFLNKFYTPITCGAVGFLGAIAGNWGTRRPYFSGIQKHIILGALGAAFGVYMDKRRDKKLAQRDQVLRSYIELHPDEFPPYERKQYKDVFEPWVPVR